MVSSSVVPPWTSSPITVHRSLRLRGSSPVGRLVEEQHRRAGDECAGEVEPATHATRVRLRRAVAGVGEVELLEQLACPDPGVAGAEVVQAPDHVEVLETGEVLVDGGVLAGDADLATGFGRIGEHVDTGDDGRAGVWPQQRREDAHGSRLAGAVRSE